MRGVVICVTLEGSNFFWDVLMIKGRGGLGLSEACGDPHSIGRRRRQIALAAESGDGV